MTYKLPHRLVGTSRIGTDARVGGGGVRLDLGDERALHLAGNIELLA